VALLEGGVQMTFAKAAVVAIGLAAAFALGVWTGPYFTDVSDRAAAAISERSSAEQNVPAARRAQVRRESHAPKMAASEPDVHKQLKPVMNMGTNMTMASEGFRDAEQFAVVAHAAHNTGIPFVVLKHRVLNEGKTLARAIAESKPDIDAGAEARRARADARESLAEVREARVAAASQDRG
jgi:hypothetical protein